MNTTYDVVIIGAGAGGLAVATSLRKRNRRYSIAIVDPASVHYYQPAFTLVGAGLYDFKNTFRNISECIPSGVSHIVGAVEKISPDLNTIHLASGKSIGYSILVVSPGLQLDWGKIKGLEENLGSKGICSNYSPTSVQYTRECLTTFNGGNAIFTQPPMPIKCAGAPQKIAYLTADYLNANKTTQPYQLEFHTATPAIFGVEEFVPRLESVLSQYGISPHYQSNLVELKADEKIAVFEQFSKEGKKSVFVEKTYEWIHVTPPQSAPDFIKHCPLANTEGWLDVDHNTLQHTQYDNVFGLGDVACTPNAKTAAAVRKQSPVVVRNIMNIFNGDPMEAGYDGYGSCPLVTAKGKVVLAEFLYGGKVVTTFPLEPTVERTSMWWLKRHLLPWMYWELMLKGNEFDIAHRPLKSLR